MSAEFAKRLIKELTDRIESTELQGTDVALILRILRNSIQQIMLDMGHTL